MNRRVSRILAMFSLFENSFNANLSVIDFLDEVNEPYDEEYYHLLVKTVLQNLSDIDYLIAKNLDNYSIDRLNLVDLNINRIAVCEFKYLDVPYQVAIDEAVEISKEYSETEIDHTHKFNNKLLDKIVKDLGL